MSWEIERHGCVAVVTMNTNKVNAQNRDFFADLHEVFDPLENEHTESPVVLTGTDGRTAGLDPDQHFRLFAGDRAAVADWFTVSRSPARRTCACSPTTARPWQPSTVTRMPTASSPPRSATTA